MEYDHPELGQWLQSFRFKKTELLAGMILAIGLGVGGILLGNYVARKPPPPRHKQADRWAQQGIIWVARLGGPAAGALFAFVMIRNMGERIEFYDQGFIHHSLGADDVWRWDEIPVMVEAMRNSQASMQIIIRLNVEHYFVFHRGNGEKFELRHTNLRNSRELLPLLEQAWKRYGFHWSKAYLFDN